MNRLTENIFDIFRAMFGCVSELHCIWQIYWRLLDQVPNSVMKLHKYTFFNSDSNKTIVQFNNQISATITASPPSSLQKKKNPKYVHLRDWSLNRLVDFSGEPITYQEECQDSSIVALVFLHSGFNFVEKVVFNFHSILQNMQL